jgi:Ribosomal protein S30
MGKVHGSLARAGKVKSQTPKVRVLAAFIVDGWRMGITDKSLTGL